MHPIFSIWTQRAFSIRLKRFFKRRLCLDPIRRCISHRPEAIRPCLAGVAIHTQYHSPIPPMPEVVDITDTEQWVMTATLQERYGRDTEFQCVASGPVRLCRGAGW